MCTRPCSQSTKIGDEVLDRGETAINQPNSVGPKQCPNNDVVDCHNSRVIQEWIYFTQIMFTLTRLIVKDVGTQT